jgi:hypothetical protein
LENRLLQNKQTNKRTNFERVSWTCRVCVDPGCEGVAGVSCGGEVALYAWDTIVQVRSTRGREGHTWWERGTRGREGHTWWEKVTRGREGQTWWEMGTCGREGHTWWERGTRGREGHNAWRSACLGLLGGTRCAIICYHVTMYARVGRYTAQTYRKPEMCFSKIEGKSSNGSSGSLGNHSVVDGADLAAAVFRVERGSVRVCWGAHLKH